MPRRRENSILYRKKCRRKRIHILLKAIPLVVSRFPNVKFVIATGPKHDQLKALAQQIGILQKPVL